MFACKPDYEEARKRMDAWWNGEILDRPLTHIAFEKPERERVPVPQKKHATLRERWLDFDFRAAETAARMENTVWAADALPVSMPNLGPDIFAGFFGCEIEFGESTSWSVPLLPDWSAESLAKVRFSPDNFYFKKMLEMTDVWLGAAKGKFIVAHTDLHAGGDALAAFRDPQELCMDMLDYPDEVKTLLDRVTDDFPAIYDAFNDRLAAAGMPSCSWMGGLACDGRFYIPQNDFSCMVSDVMYEEVFLPGIVRECERMDRCIYHLDGLQALRFLDRILAVPSIHAVQWVPGAGNDDWRRWVDVYKRIQAAKKGFPVYLPAKDLDEFFRALPKPDGAWLCLSGVSSREESAAALQKIARWGTKK